MYEKIADEFNKETLSNTANLVALSKDVYSIEKVVSIKNVSDVNKLFRLSAWVLRFIINLKKKCRNEKLNLDQFIQSSEINYVKILWLQANEQTLEEGQNFVNSKHTLPLEKDKNELYRALSRIGNADSLLHDTKPWRIRGGGTPQLPLPSPRYSTVLYHTTGYQHYQFSTGPPPNIKCPFWNIKCPFLHIIPL